MKHLQQYVDQKNQWHALFGKQSPYLDLTLCQDRQRIANMLDADLSPENLSCDGELPRSEVQRRYKQLTQVASELRALDPAVKFSEYV